MNISLGTVGRSVNLVEGTLESPVRIHSCTKKNETLLEETKNAG